MPKTFPKYIILAIAALIVSVLGVGRMPQFTTIAFLSAGGVYFISRNIDDSETRKKIITIFFCAFLAQVSASMIVYNQTVDTKYYGFSYMGDDYAYGDFGTIVGDLWRQGIFPSMKKLVYYNIVGENAEPRQYQLYNAVVFYLFGKYGGQILLIINCFLHAGIIIPLYYICRNLRMRDGSIIFACALFLFWPSTFYWSILNFKESMILFFIFSAFAVHMSIEKKTTFLKIEALLFLLLALYWLKGYLIIVSGAIILYYFIFREWRYKKIITLAALILLNFNALSKKPIVFSGGDIINSPISLYGIRCGGGLANTAYFTNLYTHDYFRTLLFLPFGISAGLFLPFLLRPFYVSQIAANIESIIWWSLIPFMIHGIWISMRRELKETFPILFVFFGWLFMIALTQGNMGTLLRQKAIIYYTGFIFIGLAIDRITAVKKG